MADEIELHYVDSQPPEAVQERWRTDPPQPIKDGRFEVVDQSFNSITWEARFMDWPAKLMIVCSLGLLWLLRGIIPLESVWRVTSRFAAESDPAHPPRTRVTIMGRADERTRAGLGEVAAQHGGSVALRVGA